MKYINKLFVATLILALSLSLVACSQKESNLVKDEKLAAKNGEHKEFIESISKEAGPSEEELKAKVKVSAKDLNDEIATLIKETKDFKLPVDSINFETVQLSINWLKLIDKTADISENEELKSVLTNNLAAYSSEDKTLFNTNFTRVVQVAKLFTDGNPAIVGLIRNANINPNEIPFVYPNLEAWYHHIVE